MDGSVRSAKVSPSRNQDVDGLLKAIDKKLDRIVAEILGRRPRKGGSAIRPKTNRSGVPLLIGRDHQQTPALLIYVLPSWRKKLKGKLPDNVRVATKFHPVKGAVGIVGTKDRHIVLGAHPGRALIRRKPHLNERRNNKRGSESLPSSSGKKGIVVKGMVCDNGLHEGECRKKGGV